MSPLPPEQDVDAAVRLLTERLQALLAGRIPQPVPAGEVPASLREMTETVNQMVEFQAEVGEFILPLSRGELTRSIPRTKNFLASPFKELHSRLLHLTWQAQQVAKGDYSQRIDFMGDFSNSFNSMVQALEVKEKQLNDKIEQLVQLNRQKNVLLGMAAHDLRSPLAVIEIYAGFLLEDLQKSHPDKELEFLRIISRQSRFMLRLIDDLLDVSAIESGQLQLDLAPGDYLAFVREHVELSRELAARKGMHLELLAPAEGPEVCFDRRRLEQVLNNLISNAIKYSPPDTVTTVSVAPEESFLMTRVIDEGPGIPPEDIPYLFKEFHKASTKPTGGEKSTGLGLAISRRIVEGHGGKIGVESTPGRGSTFWFSLPLGS